MKAYVRNKEGQLELREVIEEECPTRGCTNILRFKGERYESGFGSVAWTWDCGVHRYFEVKNNDVLGYDKKVKMAQGR